MRFEQKLFDEDHVLDRDEGLHRFDIVPAIRLPFNKLAFLTFNTTAQFRNTFWSQSQVMELVNGAEVPRPDLPRLDAPITRRFLEFGADVDGPTMVRIWDAPNSTYAQRFRHSIAPFAKVLYRTSIDNYNEIPKIEAADNIVGSATSYTYGVNTRFYAKRTGRPALDPARGHQRHHQSEIQHRRALGAVGRRPAVAQQRADVALHAGTGARAHVAVRRRHRHVQDRLRRTIQPLQKLQLRGWLGAEERMSHLASWSNVRFRPNALGVNSARQTHYFNSYTSLRFQDNRYGVTHDLNWDVKYQSLTQHRIAGYYNAQCCGFSAEYQFIDLSQFNNAGSQPDSRFHFSVTLGGIGNVSNIFGGLSGTSPR